MSKAQRAVADISPDTYLLDEIGEPTDLIEVDVSQIPDFRVLELVEPLTPLLTAFYEQPGIQEKFEKWLAERKAKAAAK